MDRLAWRRTWFQVHKWIGLVLAVLIVPLSLSGAALVWPGALGRLVTPARYAVTGDALLPPGTYARAARGVLKSGDAIAQITLPDGAGPVLVAAAPARAAPHRAGPPLRTIVYLDPPSARVLDVAASDAGVLRFLHVLHGSLLLPGVGRPIVGGIGVAMMVSCFTGLWLWWPTVGTWLRGLRYRRHRHTDANLHHLFGFWIALPLFVLSLTGAWIAFPAVFGALGGDRRAPGPDRAAMMRAHPLAAPAQALDGVIARAGGLSTGGLRSVAWPTTATPDWTVAFRNGASVKVADDSGVAVAVPVHDRPGASRLMRRIHDGDGMGPIWQAIVFVAGILPAVLAVTGVIMWWRARDWRARVATKR